MLTNKIPLIIIGKFVRIFNLDFMKLNSIFNFFYLLIKSFSIDDVIKNNINPSPNTNLCASTF